LQFGSALVGSVEAVQAYWLQTTGSGLGGVGLWVVVPVVVDCVVVVVGWVVVVVAELVVVPVVVVVELLVVDRVDVLVVEVVLPPFFSASFLHLFP